MRLATAAFLLVLAPVSSAQGLLQLALSGEVDRPGGARAEIELRYADENGEPRSTSVSLLLAERTTSADLAALLEHRLRAVGVELLRADAGQSGRAVSSLFVERALGVSLRLGQGLRASVTLCEDRPRLVSLEPGQDAPADALLVVTASTWQAHGNVRGRKELELQFDADATAAQCAERMATEGIHASWPGTIVQYVAWEPGAMVNGADVRGATFELHSTGDWRLSVELQPRRRER